MTSWDERELLRQSLENCCLLSVHAPSPVETGIRYGSLALIGETWDGLPAREFGAPALASRISRARGATIGFAHVPWPESHACGDRRQRLRNTHSGSDATDRGRPPVNPAARRQVLPMGQQPTPRFVRGVSSAKHLRLSTATKTWTPVRRVWGRHGPLRTGTSPPS